MSNNIRNLSVICFRGLFQNVRARTTCLSASRAYVIQNVCAYPSAMPKECIALSRSNPIKECVRYKSKDKSRESQRQEYESDSDDEEEQSYDLDEEGRPTISRDGIQSLRLDNFVMRIFGLTRRKTEDLLMANSVLVNDCAAIKSYEVKIDDVLELKEINPTFILKNMVDKKLKIVKIKPNCASKTFQVIYVLL